MIIDRAVYRGDQAKARSEFHAIKILSEREIYIELISSFTHANKVYIRCTLIIRAVEETNESR